MNCWIDTVACWSIINDHVGDCPAHPLRQPEKLRAVLRHLAEVAYRRGVDDGLSKRRGASCRRRVVGADHREPYALKDLMGKGPS